MTFIALRIFYGIYILGSAFILYHLVSTFLFGSENKEDKVGYEMALLLFFWPLALFSQSGRKHLRRLREKIFGL